MFIFYFICKKKILYANSVDPEQTRRSVVSDLDLHCLSMPQLWDASTCEPRHDKTNKVSVRPANPQISLGIRPVWSESSLSAWRQLASLATGWAHSEDSDQTGRMPRLIWVFAGRTAILLVLSCRGSYWLVVLLDIEHNTVTRIFCCFILFNVCRACNYKAAEHLSDFEVR